MTDQKRQDDITRTAPGGDRHRNTRDKEQHDREPAEGSRFDRERQNRDRSTYESQNQGQGPNNVGDQSRTR